MTKTLIDHISRAVENLEIPVTVPIEVDSHPTFGDYSSNVAMQYFSKLEKGTWRSPRDLAQAIVDEMQTSSPLNSQFSSITVAGPGFINFTLSDSYLQQSLVSHPDTITVPQVETPAQIIVEYMQPNTNKPLHIGHLRNSVLGKALICVLRAVGQNVTATTVNNDRGLHITKSMWAYLMYGEKSASNQEGQTWKERIVAWSTLPATWLTPADMEGKEQKGDFFVGHWYIKAESSKDDVSVQEEWSQMLQAWENPNQDLHSQVRSLWQTMNEWFYSGAGKTYQELDVTFDTVSFESNVYQAGKEIILQAVQQGIFEKLDDGAVRANLEAKFGLPDKILLRRDGTGIYMTFDVELTRQRSELGADSIFWVVGSDQDLYFQQLFAVCEMLGYGNREKFHHFSYGMVRLPEGKMSSRKGTVVYADDVIEQSISQARVVMDAAGVAKDLRENEKDAIARVVGIGAIKYTMLSYSSSSDIAFDVTTSVSFEGNSGPYLQYTGVRCKSIAQKAGEMESAASPQALQPLTPNERKLSVVLHRFEEVMLHIANTYTLHLLCGYLYELAQTFNAFYATDSVLGDADRRAFRTLLTRKTLKTLEKGLGILGIEIPEKM